MLSNVTDSRFYPECNTERGFIDQLYIELGTDYFCTMYIPNTYDVKGTLRKFEQVQSIW